MEKPIAYACPITHHRYGDNEHLPEDEVEFKFEIMPEIKAKLDSGLCLLMEVEDPEGLPKDAETGQVESKDAIRTGRMAFVSPQMIQELFGPTDEVVKTAFINKEIMDTLEIMSKKLADARALSDDSVEFEELDNE